MTGSISKTLKKSMPLVAYVIREVNFNLKSECQYYFLAHCNIDDDSIIHDSLKAKMKGNTRIIEMYLVIFNYELKYTSQRVIIILLSRSPLFLKLRRFWSYLCLNAIHVLKLKELEVETTGTGVSLSGRKHILENQIL